MTIKFQNISIETAHIINKQEIGNFFKKSENPKNLEVIKASKKILHGSFLVKMPHDHCFQRENPNVNIESFVSSAGTMILPEMPR